MVDVILCLGANLGDRASFMRKMENEVARILLPPITSSRLMETEPLGVTAGQEWYYNRLLQGWYAGSPLELLDSCQVIEKRLGREQQGKNAPRTADIDILLFGEVLINEVRLIIPHPRIGERRFCIEGLVEIAPDRIVPGSGISASELKRSMRPEVRQQEVRYLETGYEHGTT
jgi:2-amino-4-hydroxy-6-hydroxymethyldihydropteridine diphosphokinase